jgi:hypothetical protein
VILSELLEGAAADLDPVEAVIDGDGVEWSRSGRAFAAVGPAGAAFRLPSVIGRAALGTPNTSTSERGPDWVAFAPPELDRTAVDRAVAWFEAAWRHAAA